MFRGADVFAISTLNENFGNVIAESLASGVPVISTKGAPWSGLDSRGCGWWIDHGPEAMAAALRTALSLSDDQRLEMGRRGRLWMEREFSWRSVGEHFAQLYNWLAAREDRPAFVHEELDALRRPERRR
jgi:glycosyltransferase involved in cell wall biosynthesis